MNTRVPCCIQLIQEFDPVSGEWSAYIRELDKMGIGGRELLRKKCGTQIQAAAACMEIFRIRHDPYRKKNTRV